MKTLFTGAVVMLAIAAPGSTFAQEKPPVSFFEAVELIHAFSGAGDEHQRAVRIAQELAQSHPDRGYVQTLEAELRSTWELTQSGEPRPLLDYILELTEQALRQNPKLAYAYVPRARALLRASRFAEADSAIDAALRLEPNLAGAIFLRAEVHRRNMRVPEAEAAYLKFIELTSSPFRKSNSYFWLARLYQDAAWARPREWQQMIGKARSAYEKSVELDPQGMWKNVNFAIFLNDEAEDFVAAERYATKALGIAEFPMARNHLAIARYQQLVARMAAMDRLALLRALEDVAGSTNVSLDQAIAFSKSCNCHAIPARLQSIRDHLAKPIK